MRHLKTFKIFENVDVDTVYKNIIEFSKSPKFNNLYFPGDLSEDLKKILKKHFPEKEFIFTHYSESTGKELGQFDADFSDNESESRILRVNGMDFIDYKAEENAIDYFGSEDVELNFDYEGLFLVNNQNPSFEKMCQENQKKLKERLANILA